jgi:hypothetical protein
VLGIRGEIRLAVGAGVAVAVGVAGCADDRRIDAGVDGRRRRVHARIFGGGRVGAGIDRLRGVGS